MAVTLEKVKDIVILFAGDSGDGMQLTGGQFTDTVGLYGADISTFPNFPAEIRAPRGTLAGVSGFQIKFGSHEIYTPGDQFDVLVAMNSAALKVNLKNLKIGGIIIANIDGFDKKNLRLAEYIDDQNPLEDGSLDNYVLHKVDVTKLTRESLKDTGMGIKEIDRSKNMFVLGYIYWMFNQDPKNTIGFLEKKFAKLPDVRDANIKVLKTGYNYGDTAEAFTTRYELAPAKLPPGTYRNIMGNQATALGLVAASKKSGLDLFYGSYPITPASDVLHFLSRYKNFGVKTFQAEDEIAAMASVIGAAFGGALGITASSGPGIALKTEAIGLGIILELPMVILNVQRGGPSTGLPTKTEQSDLFQAVLGRNGEAPLPVVAGYSPSSNFWMAFEACRIALEYMTPVFLLSDGYIANGAEPWRFPSSADLPKIQTRFVPQNENGHATMYKPYHRDDKHVRRWAIPGMKGFEHRIGGLEKDFETGNVSYDAENHEKMVQIREAKIQDIANDLPPLEVSSGPEKGKLLVLGWGSTYGAIKTAVNDLNEEGYAVSHAQLTHLCPFPKNLGEMLRGFEKVLIPELNSGQLRLLIRARYLVDAIGLNKVQGLPLTTVEVKNKVLELIK